jgi:hypothetical protein
MASVADDLRRDTIARVRAMSVRARIELALSLGDDDLARYMGASGLDRARALERLIARRAQDRTPSRAATGR